MKSAVSPPSPSRSSQKSVEATRQARGAVAFLQQIAEDGHERAREGCVGDQGADEVRDLERDRESVDLPAAAEVVGGDALADETGDAREPGGDREDRVERASRRCAAARSLRLRRRAAASVSVIRSSSARSRPPPPARTAATSTASGEPSRTRALLPSRPATRRAFVRAGTTMPNIRQQEKRVRIAGPAAAREPALPLDDQDAGEAPRDRRRRRRSRRDRGRARRARAS